MTTEINPRLALSLAGMVSVGLTPGDDQLDRALASLLAIGLMLQTATGHDALIEEALSMSDLTVIERTADGGLLIRPRKP